MPKAFRKILHTLSDFQGVYTLLYYAFRYGSCNMVVYHIFENIFFTHISRMSDFVKDIIPSNRL